GVGVVADNGDVAPEDVHAAGDGGDDDGVVGVGNLDDAVAPGEAHEGVFAPGGGGVPPAVGAAGVGAWEAGEVVERNPGVQDDVAHLVGRVALVGDGDVAGGGGDLPGIGGDDRADDGGAAVAELGVVV